MEDDMENTATSFVERLIRWRSYIAFLLGIFVALQSTRIFIFDLAPGGLRVTLRDSLGAGAWLNGILILAIHGLFASGFWRSAAVRQQLNDEGTLANWRAALRSGFWAMMVGAAVALVASYQLPLTARGAVQIMVPLGVGWALMRFAALERRALKQ